MRTALRLLAAAVVVLGLMPGTAAATHVPDQSFKMDELFTSPNQATNSDFAFWGKHVFSGYYTGDTGSPAGTGPRGGVRIFDISNPSSPRLVQDFACDANQNDPIVWDRNGNGVADLIASSPWTGRWRIRAAAPHGPLMRTATVGKACGSSTMSDDPANPFRAITPVKMQYTDCDAHTITAWTGFADDATNPRLIVYVSSYPLRAGPTCGQANFNNVTNPYDPDKVVNDPLHRQIQVLSVPLNNPAATTEIAAPRIVYPGDPDGRIDWTERGLTGLEPAAVACHDIVTHMELNLAGAACAEQGQVWEVDPATGIPDTENPMMVADDVVTSGGRGRSPGPSTSSTR